MARQVNNGKIYSNCSIYHMDGTLMCYCSLKKMRWYLNKNLAHKIDDNSIELNFEPAGKGHAEDDYYLERKIDQCVVCGTKENLTKHHVVPYQYRKHFPNNKKTHTHFDVLCVCGECHDNYETEATKLNKKLAESYGIELTSPMDEDEKRFLKVLSYVKALQSHADNIPEDRREIMLDFISSWNGSKITLFDLDELADTFDGMSNVKKGAYAPGGKILDAWLNENNNNLHNFIVMWRQHFLDITNPKFLSKHWLEEYKTRNF